MRVLATACVVAALAACGDVNSVIVVTNPPDGGVSVSEAAAPTSEDSGVDAYVDAVGDADADASVALDAAPAGDAGSDASDPVFGSSVYTLGSAPIDANDVPEHPAAEVPLEGKNCFKAGGCHAENNHRFGFAGTVYNTASGVTGVPYAEVRVVGPNYVNRAYTDKDGNFWLTGPTPPFGSRVGVRNDTGQMVMSATVTGGAGAQCNSGSCHGLTSMRIYLP